MAAYYNEIDPYAAQWLRNLITAGHITPGDVDERSIVDVQPADLAGYRQCHFFAGIGGWSYALLLAAWPDDRPVWTGSCPCQPFSVAGERRGFDDKRHLWPDWQRLIAECRPPTVFGEQVAAATDWLARVRSDLEALGYAVGAAPVEAACAGSHQLRDRFWFVADSNVFVVPRKPSAWELSLAQQDHEHRARPVVNAPRDGWGEGWTEHELRSRGLTAAVASFRNCQFVECPDGKWRALPPPGVRWLGNGIPARNAKLRGLGNAIDPRPAAAFIRAAADALGS